MSWITSISQLSSAVLLISVGLSMQSIRLPFFSINPRLILHQFLSIGGRNPMMNFLITLFLPDPATPATSSAKDALSIVHMNCMDIWTQIGYLQTNTLLLHWHLSTLGRWHHRIQTRLQLTVPLSSTEAVEASFMILLSLTTQQRNYTRTITHGL